MAQKRPNLVQNLHFWSFWAKYCHFLHILSNARPKNNVNKVPRWVFRYVGNKTFDFSSKKKDFLPKNDQIWPKIGIFGQFGPGHAGLFNALLWVGWWLWRAGCISQDTYLLYLGVKGFSRAVKYLEAASWRSGQQSPQTQITPLSLSTSTLLSP